MAPHNPLKTLSVAILPLPLIAFSAFIAIPTATAAPIACGNLTIEVTSGDLATCSAGQSSVTLTNGVYKISQTNASIPIDMGIIINPTSTAQVTVDSLNIESSSQAPIAITGSGESTINALGNNSFVSTSDSKDSSYKPTIYNYAGIQKAPNTGTLTLTSQTAGKIIAQGGYSSAGIGGAPNMAGTNINITGNINIVSTGSTFGAGIGGGHNARGSLITIKENAVVEANAGLQSAGIGGGWSGPGLSISISDSAQVTAVGQGSGAGIGGSSFYSGIPDPEISKDISISDNAIVDATGGHYGAGIGGGQYGSFEGLTISGNPTVNAKSNESGTGYPGGRAAGIGGGYGGNAKNISISGGNITATGGTYSSSQTLHYGGAGIGGGSYDSYVTNSGTAENVTISGGTVTATGGYNAQGIGKGYDPANKITKPQNISITGENFANPTTVTAKGIGYVAAISPGTTVTPTVVSTNPDPVVALWERDDRPPLVVDSWEEPENSRVAYRKIVVPVAQYTVTLELNGGELDAGDPSGPFTFTEFSNNPTTIEAIPTKPDHEFLGWVTDINSGNNSQEPQVPISIPTDTKQNVTVTAVFKPLTSTLSFDANEGTGNIDAIVGSDGQVINLPNSGFTRDNYVLTSWNTDPDGNGTSFELGTEFTFSATDTVLYAQWHPVDEEIVPTPAQTTTESTGPTDNSSSHPTATTTSPNTNNSGEASNATSTSTTQSTGNKLAKTGVSAGIFVVLAGVLGLTVCGTILVSRKRQL